MDRYHRQTLLLFVGSAGQQQLLKSRILLVGCGALGCAVAEQLARAGMGNLIIVDRDVVELTNLQRQVLFDESDARQGIPKAIAGARRLSAVNSQITVTPHVLDLHAGNIESLADVDLIVDGTDNVETRYLINDVAVKRKIPWIYGGCVAAEGRVMTIRPGITPCLRCVFPEPPSVGELQTCDTAGVLGPAIAVVGGYQAAAALKLLTGHPDAVDPALLKIDFWKNRQRQIDIGNRRGDCECCGLHRYRFLDRPVESSAAALCGRNSVQVRPAHPAQINLAELSDRLSAIGRIDSSPYLLRIRLNQPPEISLTIFPDGRCIVQGTTDLARARTLVSQYVGT
jgi:adenylyltransferase/sulfurtransferase